ncbi:MAG: diaminopimelate decarboxylase [Kiritimatiellia bacterium]
MSEKRCPLTKEQLAQIGQTYPTPFYVYDERALRQNVRNLLAAFSWNPGFREYFAVKATPNPYIMKVLAAEGLGADCSSGPELRLSALVGLKGDDIIFTSNDTPAYEYQQAQSLGAILNLDDITHISFVEKALGAMPETICFRYNPGALREGNTIIGHPEEAKYGFTREQIIAGYEQVRDLGVKRFGLHTMVASNELSADYFVETARMLFALAVEVHQKVGIKISFVNLGGGIGIPYRPAQEAVDLAAVGRGIEQVYREIIVANGLDPVSLALECGRMITGPYGYLVSRVRHIKDTYKHYVGLDACMANLMRPGMYGAYHHITVPGKEHLPCDQMCDVTGSLCENNDKFAIDRMLPVLEPGDWVVIHDAGAHGHSMGFNYNGKLRCAELLLREDGELVQIRRAETEDDLFATLDVAGLTGFAVTPDIRATG